MYTKRNHELYYGTKSEKGIKQHELKYLLPKFPFYFIYKHYSYLKKCSFLLKVYCLLRNIKKLHERPIYNTSGKRDCEKPFFNLFLLLCQVSLIGALL